MLNDVVEMKMMVLVRERQKKDNDLRNFSVMAIERYCTLLNLKKKKRGYFEG